MMHRGSNIRYRRYDSHIEVETAHMEVATAPTKDSKACIEDATYFIEDETSHTLRAQHSYRLWEPA